MSAATPIRQRALVAFGGPVAATGLALGVWLVPATSGGVAGKVLAGLVAVLVPIVLVVMIPVRAIADRVEAHIRPSLPSGRVHDAAADVAVALGDASSLLARESEAIDVTGLPTSRRDIVIVSSGAFEVLTRREVVALACARFAALRDPWCRLATQGALAWWALRFVLPFGLLGFVAGAVPLGIVSVLLLFAVGLAPNWPTEVRNRCADMAAIERTVDPGGLAGAVRRVSGLGRRHDDLGVDPHAGRRRELLAVPRLAGGEMTANVGFDKHRRRHIIHCLRLLAAAEAQVGMVEPVGVEPASGDDLRRRWAQVGRPVTMR
ncbi:MAG: hypothetical protein AAGA90_15745 [Actinomycetota bacterium]